MTKPPDVSKHDPAAKYSDSMGKYIVIYLCILVIAALQFAIAYQHIGSAENFERMLFLALVEGGLAIMFFMHLWAERRGFCYSSLFLRDSFYWPCNTHGPTVIVWKWAPPTRTTR